MSKRKGCLILILFAIIGFVVLVWQVWVQAKGSQEIIDSFAADTSGIENPYLDFPTKGPIVCDTRIIRWPRRALAGRFDPVAFEEWAKRHPPFGAISWNADLEIPYRDFIRSESLVKDSGLPLLMQGNGDKMMQFCEQQGRLIHTLDVNNTQGTFMFTTTGTDGDGEKFE